MDSEVRAAVTLPEAPERAQGRAPLSEERMEQFLRELEPLARRLARQWAREHALHQAEELIARYQPLVHKVAIKWSRLWPAQRKDIAQEISLTLWQVLQRRPDAPLNYLTAVANKAASKYLSRGASVDRPLRLKRRRRWEMVPLELLSADEEGDGFVPEDKVRRHQHADRWTSVVEDVVVARLLYLDIHGHLSKMERKVLQASVLGYRNSEIATLLGLTYQQVKRARHRIAAKARNLWDGHMELPAALPRARK
jgi:RNA polymerase sigma factor (sigma-70 family)